MEKQYDSTVKFSSHLWYISSTSAVLQPVISEKPPVLFFILANTMLTLTILPPFPLSAVVVVLSFVNLMN